MANTTRADLRDAIYARLDGNTRLYTDTEVHAAIDDAIRALNLFTGYIQQTTTHTSFTDADEHIYDVPSGYLFLTKVEISGRVLDKTGLGQLCNSHPDWLRETTSNTGVPVSRWCPIGLNKFAIHPADSIGNQTLKLSGVKEPSSMSSDTSTIPIPDEFGDIIEDIVLSYLPMKEGGLVFQQAALGYQGFLRRMKELNRFTHHKNPQYYVEVKSSS